MSRPYAEVIGDPISHSKSPLIHNFWLRKLGIDAEYRSCHVRPDELADYFAQRRRDADWRGCNVTIPHKVAALAFIDLPGAMVGAVGATNCIVPRDGKLGADNTDIYGVGQALSHELDGVCVIGAGGAARAALAALDQGLASDIRIVARDCEKARADLSSDFKGLKFYSFREVKAAMQGVRGVINASPLGMVGHAPMPGEVIDALEQTRSDAFTFDMVYAPLETDLLIGARVRGRKPIDGLTMLISQASFAFRLFFGVFPDRNAKFSAELRALLTA